MRFRRRGKIHRRVPEVVMTMDDIVAACERTLAEQGITTGDTVRAELNKQTRGIELTFQDRTPAAGTVAGFCEHDKRPARCGICQSNKAG